MFELDKLKNWEKLILSSYFSLTMLSTVGYGDFYPINTDEMIYCSIMMLIGVGFFSYIMGSGIEILSSYREKMGS